jgi:hypothetical protein
VTLAPPPTHDLTHWDEAEACFALGYQTALADIAARTVDLHTAWQPIGRATRQQRIAAEHTTMRAAADQVAAELGRPIGYTYRGGPVDWDTGMPAGSACAWLRRHHATAVRADPRQVAA